MIPIDSGDHLGPLGLLSNIKLSVYFGFHPVQVISRLAKFNSGGNLNHPDRRDNSS